MYNFYFYGQSSETSSINSSENVTEESFLKSKQILLQNLDLDDDSLDLKDEYIGKNTQITEITENLHKVEMNLANLIESQQKETGNNIKSIRKNLEILSDYETFLSEKEKEVDKKILLIRDKASKRKKRIIGSPNTGVSITTKTQFADNSLSSENISKSPQSEFPTKRSFKNIFSNDFKLGKGLSQTKNEQPQNNALLQLATKSPKSHLDNPSSTHVVPKQNF